MAPTQTIAPLTAHTVAKTLALFTAGEDVAKATPIQPPVVELRFVATHHMVKIILTPPNPHPEPLFRWPNARIRCGHPRQVRDGPCGLCEASVVNWGTWNEAFAR